jgi:hypothetical protein
MVSKQLLLPKEAACSRQSLYWSKLISGKKQITTAVQGFWLSPPPLHGYVGSNP